MIRFRFISAHRAAYGIRAAVSPAGGLPVGFYAWLAGAPARAERAAADAALTEQIRAIHAEFGGTYGSPRVTAELRHQGVQVNRKRIERLMRQGGIVGLHLRRKPRTTISDRRRSSPPTC